MAADLEVSIGVDVSQLGNGLNNATKRLEDFGQKISNIGQKLSVGVSLPLGILANKILQSTQTFEKLELALTAIEGSAEGAKKRLKELELVAKMPGIGFEQAVQGDVRLRAVGIAAEQSKKILTQFANAIAFTGGTAVQLDLVTYQLGQMSAKGKVLGNDLRPIIEQAPAVGKALSEMFGTTSAEDISKAIESQGKNASDFIDMLVKKLEEVPRVQGGFSNAMDNIGNTLTKFFASVGSQIVEDFGLTKLIDNLSDSLETASQFFNQLDPNVRKAIAIFGGLAIVIPPLLIAFGGLLTVLPIIGTALAAVTLPMVAIGVAIGALAVVIVRNWSKIQKTLTDNKVFQVLKSLFASTFEILLGVLNLFIDALEGNWSGVWGNIKKILEGAVNGIVTIIQGMVLFVGKSFSKLYSLFGLDTFARLADKLTNSIVEVGEKAKFKINGLDETSKKVKSLIQDIKKITTPVVPPVIPPATEKTKTTNIDPTNIFSGIESSAFTIKEVKETPLDKYLKDLKEKALKSLSDSTEELRKKASELGNNISVSMADGFGEGFSKEVKKIAKKLNIDLTDGLNEAEAERISSAMNMGRKFGEAMAQGINAAISIGLNFLAGLIENAFKKGTEKLTAKQMFGGLLNALGELLIAFGSSLILIQLAKDSIKNPLTAGPGAIALGVGLVAAGAALKGFGGQMSQGASSSSSSVSTGSGARNIVPYSNPQSFNGGNVKFEIQGNTLVGVLNNVNRANG